MAKSFLAGSMRTKRSSTPAPSGPRRRWQSSTARSDHEPRDPTRPADGVDQDVPTTGGDPGRGREGPAGVPGGRAVLEPRGPGGARRQGGAQRRSGGAGMSAATLHNLESITDPILLALEKQAECHARAIVEHAQHYSSAIRKGQ